jgi:hypothetical protein
MSDLEQESLQISCHVLNEWNLKGFVCGQSEIWKITFHQLTAELQHSLVGSLFS